MLQRTGHCNPFGFKGNLFRAHSNTSFVNYLTSSKEYFTTFPFNTERIVPKF